MLRKTRGRTNKRYTYGGLRRDNLFIKGAEYTGRGRNKRVNALCCQTILFFTITNLKTLRRATPFKRDSVTFVLGRWFQPHPSARLRDSMNRPMCPGALQTNHCLWTYALAKEPRRALEELGGQKHLFGENLEEQNSRLDTDSRAYYCLLEPDNILSISNMCPEFIGDTAKPDYTRWLQSVTLI